MSWIIDKLKSIDAFPKALDDFKVKTTTGGIVSIFSVTLMIMLLTSELVFYIKPKAVDRLYVASGTQNTLRVVFDVSFPSISCNLISIDAVDDMNKPLEGSWHEIYKHKLSKDGELLDNASPLVLGNTLQSEDQVKTLAELHKSRVDRGDILCGNCYGSLPAGKCCNTCESVRDAYSQKGWTFKAAEVEQCSDENFMTNLKEQFAEEGGCQVYGKLELSKVSGHFHISPHMKLHTAGLTGDSKGGMAKLGKFDILQLLSFTYDQFNITHRVNSFSFGDHFPGIKSPLDGQYRLVEDTHGMYQYYMKVVPTQYKNINDEVIVSNQYAVTEHVSHLAPGSGRGFPGLYFYYDVSPIQSMIEEKRGNFLRFLTSACALVGGLFTVLGLADSIISYFALLLSGNPLGKV